MSILHDSEENMDLDPETLKKAGLYKLIEELVLSEYERAKQEQEVLMSHSNESHIIKQPAGHGGSHH